MKPGAYGLRLAGEAPRSDLLTEVVDGAPIITITRSIGTSQPPNVVEEAAATVPLINNGGIELTRADRSAHITTPEPLTDDELAHPYLAPIAAVHNHWLGRAAFHAGGVVVDGKAWGVIGVREAGKSTMLAALDSAGIVVLADDLLILEGDKAFSGPRTLDLREEAAAHFGSTRDLGIAGARERWRLDLGAAPPFAPFAGWIVPQWGEALRVWREPGAGAAHHIAPARSVGGLAISPQAFMAAAARPTVVFERPHDLEALKSGVEALLNELVS